MRLEQSDFGDVLALQDVSGRVDVNIAIGKRRPFGSVAEDLERGSLRGSLDISAIRSLLGSRVGVRVTQHLLRLVLQ